MSGEVMALLLPDEGLEPWDNLKAQGFHGLRVLQAQEAVK